ncbi:Gfo/Idh/MocA family oxidoreductase [Hyphomicrobiales bacterium]|nr:Gfo/Idh/MocA family oxidoreductase [Hyphomicrobiales bacterium]
MTIKVGIIGCGRQAPKHISGYQAYGNVELTVADIVNDSALALSEKFSTRVMSLDEIINDPEIKIVSVCTPVNTHDEIITRLVENKKHFICEKPLSTSQSKLDSINAKIEKNNLVGMVGYIYRFASAFTLGKKFIDKVESSENNISESIDKAYFRIGGPGSHAAWQHKKDQQGGAINEMLVHMLDLMIWYFGNIIDIYEVKKQIHYPARIINGKTVNADAEDYVLIRVKTEKLVDVTIEADLISSSFNQYVNCSGKKSSFTGSIQKTIPTCLGAENSKLDSPSVHIHEYRNLYIDQMKYFLDCVLKSNKHDKCTLEDSINILNSIQRIQNFN